MTDDQQAAVADTLRRATNLGYGAGLAGWTADSPALNITLPVFPGTPPEHVAEYQRQVRDAALSAWQRGREEREADTRARAAVQPVATDAPAPRAPVGFQPDRAR